MRKLIVFVAVVAVFEVTQASPSTCNPLSCLISINALFKSDQAQTLCLRFQEVQRCVSICAPLFSEKNDQDLKDGLQRISNKICKDEKAMKLGQLFRKKCIELRKFQMLTCIYEAWNLITEEQPVPLQKKNLIICRRIFEVEKCPSDVYTCKDDANSNYIEYLSMSFFAPFQEEFCFGYTYAEVWALEVNPIPNINGYKNISKCLDVHFKQLMSCIPNHWIENYTDNDYQHQEFCTAFDIFLDCVNVMIDKNCGEAVSHVFMPISQKIHRAFHAECTKYTTPASTTENVGSRQVLTPHTPEVSELSWNLENNNSNKSAHKHDDLQDQFIIVHYTSFDLSGSDHKRIAVVFLPVFLTFASVFQQ